MTDCPRAGKLFGCKFTGRFDRHGAVNISDAVEADPAVLEAMKPRIIYVRDVCERCGKTVERVKA